MEQCNSRISKIHFKVYFITGICSLNSNFQCVAGCKHYIATYSYFKIQSVHGLNPKITIAIIILLNKEIPVNEAAF